MAQPAGLPTGSKLDFPFFQRPAIDVARELIGAILVRRIRRRTYCARIVETEAYVGAHDLACHASKGRTRRTEVMFGPGGYAYVYLIYGMYDMFNIVASVVDDPQAVLIRAAQPLANWTADMTGPGKLARALQIDRSMNGLGLTGNTLCVLADPDYSAQVIETSRIGIDYAGPWKDALLRFVDVNSDRNRSRAREGDRPIFTDKRQSGATLRH